MNDLIKAPKSWENPKEHFLTLLDDEWYIILAKLENTITLGTYEFYSKKGYYTMHLPITTGSISSPMGRGSDSSPVKIQLFGVDTYLADSMQFMLEYGCRLHKSGCYYIMPSFRGESADSRHLCQFYHSEVEIEGSMEDVLFLAEEYIRFLCQKLILDNEEDITKIVGNLNHIEKFLDLKSIPRVNFEDAIQILKQKFPNEDLYSTDIKDGFRIINRNGEKRLMEEFDGIVWLTHFDHLSVPFYQAFDITGKYAKNADLLFGIGEVVGAGERHFDGDAVNMALKLHDVNPEEYDWYISMKMRRPLKTSGFGMGVERFLLWILQHDDIRDLQILPRFNGVICNP